MHIEPHVIDGAKLGLAYATAAAAAGYTLKLAAGDLAKRSAASLVVRSAIAAVGTFIFFEVLPHFAVGVSEVHLILGTTLFLLLGAAPAAFGLGLGLLIQGLFFAPSDLPMYAVNLTTLLMPLFAIDVLARRIIPQDRAYVDLTYAHVLKLSGLYQGGIVAWVAFWAIYGQGLGAENLHSVWTFGAAYLLVIVIEPVADLGALAAAKMLRRAENSGFVSPRLYKAG